MKRFSAAILLSVLVHALLAGGLALCIAFGDFSVELPVLDLSSVELSFSEEESEAAPPSAAMPAASPSDDAKPREPPPPDVKPKFVDLLPPPDAGALEVLRPEEGQEELPEIRVTEVSSEPAAPAPRQARIDAPPRPLVAIHPDYPRESKQRGEQGRVLVEVRINERGLVDAVRVVESSGFAALDAAAVKAVGAAKFRPARAGGRPVADTRRLPVEFRLK